MPDRRSGGTEFESLQASYTVALREFLYPHFPSYAVALREFLNPHFPSYAVALQEFLNPHFPSYAVELRAFPNCISRRTPWRYGSFLIRISRRTPWRYGSFSIRISRVVNESIGQRVSFITDAKWYTKIKRGKKALHLHTVGLLPLERTTNPHNP